MSHKPMTPLQRDILNYISTENGVRTIDISQRFKTTMNIANAHLNALREKEKVVAIQIEGLNAFKWVSLISVNLDRYWHIPDTAGIELIITPGYYSCI